MIEALRAVGKTLVYLEEAKGVVVKDPWGDETLFGPRSRNGVFFVTSQRQSRGRWEPVVRRMEGFDGMPFASLAEAAVFALKSAEAFAITLGWDPERDPIPLGRDPEETWRATEAMYHDRR